MSIPNFTAEESLYVTKNHYRMADGRGFSTGGTVDVIPQDCGWVRGILCGGLVATAVLVCGASCAAGAAAGPLGGIPCWECLTVFGLVTGAYCFECLPGWIQDVINGIESIGGGGGGGGGGSGINRANCGCPSGKKCCGTCTTVTVGNKPVPVCTHCC
jgi:hypothetical protein